MFGPEYIWQSDVGLSTDKMIEEYIAQQEGEPIHDDSQFVIAEDMSYRLLGGSRSLAIKT